MLWASRTRSYVLNKISTYAAFRASIAIVVVKRAAILIWPNSVYLTELGSVFSISHELCLVMANKKITPISIELSIEGVMGE